jgi:dihydrofolate reductase
VVKLKSQLRKVIVIIGSPRVTQTFLNIGLLDQFQLNINPVLLNRGIRLFKDIESRCSLTLVATKQFASGIVSLYYQS